MSIPGTHVCCLEPLYSGVFNYSLPRAILESFFDGKAFDNKESYSAEERRALEMDIQSIWDKMVGRCGTQNPQAIISAGAPGSGKTYLMRQEIEKNKWSISPYIDPDDVCLKNMLLTYGAELAAQTRALGPAANGAAKNEVRLRMYNKWRPASNAGTHVILGNLIRKKMDFYYGTTATSPATAKFFQFLKEKGYRIKMLHVSAPDDVRWKSIQRRDRDFIQTSEQDVKEKGLLFPQRIQDTYLKFADEIQFFYRDGEKDDNAILAATWTQAKKPILQIHDPHAYSEVKKIHDTMCKTLNRPDISWERTVEASVVY